jgi:hypothetical protein
VIWPRTRRRVEHVLTALALKLGATAVPTKTDFNSAALDAAVKPLIKKHGIELPPDCDFSVTKE